MDELGVAGFGFSSDFDIRFSDLRFMNPLDLETLKFVTRRKFFQQCGTGMGALALASLLNENLFAAAAKDLAAAKPPGPHFKPKAKNIIYLFQSGGPSHLDLFDYKPELIKRNGQKMPAEILKNIRLAQIGKDAAVLGTNYKFKQYGKSGVWLSELLPHLSTVVDEVAFVQGFYSEAFNHDPATLFMNTGAQLAGRPSMGAWFSYGLGSENKDLPAFVVLMTGVGQPLTNSAWGSGFLPTVHQGVPLRSQGEPVLFVSNPAGMTAERRRQSLDVLKDLNEKRFEVMRDPEIQTRIAQLYQRGWDHHGGADGNLIFDLKKRCKETDQPAMALIKDLKQRGLLDETLVVWGGEFGRTPMMQGNLSPTQIGRDHHPHGYTVWLAGGGIKPGIRYGGTDEFGFYASENKVHVHDLHATILHLFGLDHTKLTYRFQGRDFRLTDVQGEVVKALLA